MLKGPHRRTRKPSARTPKTRKILLPPSRGPEGEREPPAVKRRRKGGPASRQAAGIPTRRALLRRALWCGAVLGKRTEPCDEVRSYRHSADQAITTRIELFRATCPAARPRVTARTRDMPEGTPLGPGIEAMIPTCTAADDRFKRLTEVLPGLVGLRSAGRHRQRVARSARQSRRRPRGRGAGARKRW